MVLATHGWWPWLLMYAVIVVLVVFAVRYLIRRRKAV